jgi:hypothetical protein
VPCAIFGYTKGRQDFPGGLCFLNRKNAAGLNRRPTELMTEDCSRILQNKIIRLAADFRHYPIRENTQLFALCELCGKILIHHLG